MPGPTCSGVPTIRYAVCELWVAHVVGRPPPPKAFPTAQVAFCPLSGVCALGERTGSAGFRPGDRKHAGRRRGRWQDRRRWAVWTRPCCGLLGVLEPCTAGGMGALHHVMHPKMHGDAVQLVALRCVALGCVALRCVTLRCVALRCVTLRWVALRVKKHTSSHFWLPRPPRSTPNPLLLLLLHAVDAERMAARETKARYDTARHKSKYFPFEDSDSDTDSSDEYVPRPPSGAGAGWRGSARKGTGPGRAGDPAPRPTASGAGAGSEKAGDWGKPSGGGGGQAPPRPPPHQWGRPPPSRPQPQPQPQPRRQVPPPPPPPPRPAGPVFVNMYEVLGVVNFTATDKELKRAYHALALKYHPDKAAVTRCVFAVWVPVHVCVLVFPKACPAYSFRAAVCVVRSASLLDACVVGMAPARSCTHGPAFQSLGAAACPPPPTINRIGWRVVVGFPRASRENTLLEHCWLVVCGRCRAVGMARWTSRPARNDSSSFPPRTPR